MEKSTWILLGVLGVGGVWLLSRNKGAAAEITPLPGETAPAADLAKIMANTQAKLDAAAKLAASGDYAGASKKAQDAATVAFNAGNTDAASEAAIKAAAYADQTSQVAAATAALVTNTYVAATPATVAANVSTAFEIANSGLGGTAAVGKTITVTGVDGAKTFINTGNGYAEYTTAFQTAMSQVTSANQQTLINAAVSRGAATQAQLNAMSSAQLKVYLATLLANDPTMTTIATGMVSTVAPVAVASYSAGVTPIGAVITALPGYASLNTATTAQITNYNHIISQGFSAEYAASMVGINL